MSDAPHEHPSDGAVVVVSGLPRSGTSLMMQMLEAAGLPLLVDAARPADASNPRGYYELEAVKHTRADAGWAEDAAGRAVKVIHALLPELPRDRRYRVLLMERDLTEVVRSQAAMLERLGRPRAAIPAERLAAAFAQQLTRTRELLRGEACFEWMPVSHAALLATPFDVARSVEAFLGLSGSAEAMAACIDPALHREHAG